jgi:transketolase
MEMSGGSLGQGLSIAVGMALGLRQKQSKAWVYNSMSDGELDEGRPGKRRCRRLTMA